MFHEPIEKFEHAGLTISIFPDDLDGSSPLEWDNLGTMVAFDRLAREYREGYAYDRRSTFTEDDAVERGGAALLARYLRLTEGAEVVPFHFADYGSGGARLWPTDLYDDSPSGFFTVDRAKIVEEYGNDSPASRESARACLIGETKTMGQYVEGDVWGYVVEDEDRNHLDSVWGFYGMDDVIAEAKSSAEWAARDRALDVEPDVEMTVFNATKENR